MSESSPRSEAEQVAAPRFGAADALTALRLPLAAWFVLTQDDDHRLVILVIAGVSDLLDGALARRVGPSRLGAFLDPVADKLFMKADNRGEGGILALLALIRPRQEGHSRWVLVTLGLFGAALLYGDGVITPAISVLGAVEGLKVATSSLDHVVWVITIVILVVLFVFQGHGSTRVGRVFGPIMGR